jgi:hypothetical protein
MDRTTFGGTGARTAHKATGFALTMGAALILAACGGSGGGSAAGGGGGGGGGGGSTTTPVGVKVIDGALRNALVCVDSNNNGACDAGEISARTDAAGNATLQVPTADAGKSPILAIVDTDAVDADHGPVTTRYVMKAPADQTAVVSPLTTLVQSAVEQTGVSSTQAASTVATSLGLNVSLFQDYTKSTTTDNVVAGTVARMVVVATQQQSAAVDGAEGTKALDGTTITQADLDKLVAQKLLQLMPQLAAALATPAVQAAIAQAVQDQSLASVNTAVSSQATTLVASSGITVGAVTTLVAVNNQQSGTSTVPASTPGGQITSLVYNDPSNWTRFANIVSPAGAVPDANGLLTYIEARVRSAGGAIANWTSGGDASRQSDLHWNGSSWVACSLNQANHNTPYDTQGRSTFDTCDKAATGSASRAVFDVAGKRLIDVYNQARDAGNTNLTIANAVSVLGTAVFPTNAKLIYQTSSVQQTAAGYAQQISSIVRVNTGAALIAGDAVACNALAASPAPALSSYTAEPGTLEAMVAAARGNACAYQQHNITGLNNVPLSSGTRNEAWGFPSVFVGTVGNEPLVGAPNLATTFFTSNQMLRVAFGDNGSTTYYSCRQRSWDNSARNCDAIGTGTYTISTLGDARVLALNNQPAQFGALNYERVFVQRGGKVYLGYKNRPSVSNSARLNLEGANALLQQLNLPTFTSSTTTVPTPASYQGDWLLWDASTGINGYEGEATMVRINPNYNGGTSGYQCFNALTGSPVSPSTCTISLDPATGVLSFADSTSTATVTLNLVTATATGSANDGGATISVIGRRR